MSRRKYTCLKTTTGTAKRAKKTDKYGMTDEKNENAKNTEKKKIVMALTAMTRAAPNRYSDKNRQ